MNDGPEGIAKAAAEVAAAYLGNNKMSSAEVPEFCRRIADALASGRSPAIVSAATVPAIDPANSVTDDWVICLEDGVRMKMMKRHLRVKFRMTPEQYRAKWGLPEDYPMVAPAHARRRAAIAMETGFLKKA